jgi:hypothetical protein
LVDDWMTSSWSRSFDSSLSIEDQGSDRRSRSPFESPTVACAREVGLEPLIAHRAAGDLFEELALGH